MPRDPRLRIADIVDALQRVCAAVDGVDRVAFRADDLRVRAVAYDFVVIGEASGHVPEAIQREAPEVPWVTMRAMRNKLAHEYFALSADVLYITATRDLSPLLEPLSALLERLGPP